jgi:hypothetical protein
VGDRGAWEIEELEGLGDRKIIIISVASLLRSPVAPLPRCLVKYEDEREACMTASAISPKYIDRVKNERPDAN